MNLNYIFKYKNLNLSLKKAFFKNLKSNNRAIK